MNPATFLALGDSYTIGEGVDADERWPAQLARRLAAHGVAVAEPLVVARTGWTTDELSAAMDATTFAPPYDLVTLLIGVNNQYRGRTLDNYRDELAALLARACGLSLREAVRIIREKGAAEVLTAVFARKPWPEPRGTQPDFVGWEAPARYLVGYGLDTGGKMRGLPGVCAMD